MLADVILLMFLHVQPKLHKIANTLKSTDLFVTEGCTAKEKESYENY